MAQPPPRPPVARPATRFVGRRRALRWLQLGLEQAASGVPGFFVVSGEAGIGKTRLVRELAERARERGFVACVARCDERSSEPYRPLTDSLFPMLRRVDRASPLSPRTDSALRALLGQVEAAATPIDEILDDPFAANRYDARLLLDLTDLAIGLAQRQRLLLVVDDLAWADPSTFRFLVRLAVRAADLHRRTLVPLLVIATTRPELEPARQAELDRLCREGFGSSTELEGLDVLETADLLRELGVLATTPAVAAQVHHATTGNPLFVETVGARLLSQGASAQRDVSGLAQSIPREIWEAVGEALDLLSPACRAVLRLAAVLGPTAKVDAVAELSELDATSFEDALGEALRHGVLEKPGELLRFRHPLFRTVIYQSVQPARRRRLHATIAERWGEEQSRAALAQHLLAAGPEIAPARIARGCVAAAEEAAAVFAWREAARFYREALAAEDRAPGVFEDAELARLLRSAGVASDLALDGAEADRFLTRAAEAFERLHDPRALVQVAVARIRCVVAHRSLAEGSAAISEAAGALASALAKISDSDPALYSQALAALAESKYASGDLTGAADLAGQALDAARTAHSSEGVVRAAVALALPEMMGHDLARCLRLLGEARAAAANARDPRLLLQAASREPLALFWQGRLAEAESGARQALELAQQVNDPVLTVVPLAALVSAAVVRGDTVEAEERAYEAALVQRFSSYTWVNGAFPQSLATLCARRGEPELAQRALAMCGEGAPGSWSLPSVALWYAEQFLAAKRGDLDAARRELEAHPERADLDRWPILAPASFAGALVELADLLDEPRWARGSVRVLAATLEAGESFSRGLMFHVGRMLAIAERLLGEPEQAAARLRDVVGETASAGAWMEHALALRELARALPRERPEDRERALAVARTARDALAGLGLEAELPLAEGVLAELASSGSSERPPTPALAPLAILFTDVEGSTPLVERLGDARAFELLRAHERLVREQLAAWDGREVDQEGDSFFATFVSAEHAARCAVAIQRNLARLPLGETIRLRMGLHVGEVLSDSGRFFGLNVIVASRIADSAQAGEILVSDAVRDALGGHPTLRFGSAREVELKGLSRSHDVLPLLWNESALR